MANYWTDPVPNRPMALPYGNLFMQWGPLSFTAPRGGANLPPEADYQPPAPPATQALPVGPAPAVMPDTELAPAGLPTQQTGSLAPAVPTQNQDSNAATPAAPRPQPDHGADRAQGVAAAPYAANAAGAAPTPAPERGAPSNEPSRASGSNAAVAPPAAAAAPVRQDVAVGGALPAGPPQGYVDREDVANEVDDETVVGDDDDDDAATMLDDDEEEFWTDDDDDDEYWTDDDDEQPVRYVQPVLRPVFNWD